ncbi:Calcium-transporting ATPase 4, endoplasmic reticulum-type [Dendrobium catenatum]|uniref:Calcium-transporting ATPase 4, endoplasmic reticulum-type n=1 Tax=Dendrobium catenatum TaxID=906689 RepID=A0A2I0X759_9ASPA|nr:Calcium-transporting ATPase 4, endoplasmic reticulum-type [Dendrobium catenatum]
MLDIFCNDANITHCGNRFISSGMPAALKVLVEKMGLPGGYPASSTPSFNILRCCEWWKGIEQRIATLEFDQARKSM